MQFAVAALRCATLSHGDTHGACFPELFCVTLHVGFCRKPLMQTYHPSIHSITVIFACGNHGYTHAAVKVAMYGGCIILTELMLVMYVWKLQHLD